MVQYGQTSKGPSGMSYLAVLPLPLLLLVSCQTPQTAFDRLPSLLPEPSQAELDQQADERRFLNYGIPMP